MSDNPVNVDYRQIAKFEALAAHWWDPKGKLKTLHHINPLRLEYIAQHTDGLSGKRILDVGCGGGILCEGMAAQGAQVTGIDVAEASLSVARSHLLESGLEVEYQQATAEQLAAEQLAAFDVITCLELLEHVPDPTSLVAACARLARPGGYIFFSTINRNLKSYLFSIIGTQYVLPVLPKSTHNHARFIRPSELTSWIFRADLMLHNLTGLQYNPLTRNYRLSPDVAVNYLTCCVKPTHSTPSL